MSCKINHPRAVILYSYTGVKMFNRRNQSVYRFFLIITALLVIMLLSISVQAGEIDSDPNDTDPSEAVTIPGYSQNAYGFCYTGDEHLVRIPADIRELNHYFFYKNNTVQAVIVPETVAFVSDSAFYRCTSLRYICFMSSRTRIADRFLNGAPSLINISAPKDSALYSKCIKDRIPVTASRNPCFSKKKVHLLPGDTEKMPLFNSLEAKYSSSNKKIVTVDDQGTIHARKKGSATVTAVSGGKKYSFKVTVYKKNENDRIKQIRKSEKITGSQKKITRIKAVHDWMVRNISYDYYNSLNGSLPGIAHTSKGALIRKLCVCDGYAYGFLKIMRSMNIPCKVVHGTADGVSHAWNMVYVGSKWYHIDVTWDDPIIENSNANTVPRYTYFMKSTEYMKANSHHFKEKKYPKCTSKKYDKKGLSGYFNFLSTYIYKW